MRPLMSVGVAPRSLILLQGPPPARGRFPTPERLSNRIPTPKSAPGQCSHTEVQRAIRPTSFKLVQTSGWLSGEGGCRNALRSPLPCSAAPCWETTLMMLSQSPGSRQRKKTPHTKDFKKIVQREAGGRNVSRSRVQFACRSALGDHPSFPTPEEDAPLQNDNFPHQSGVVEYAPLL